MLLRCTVQLRLSREYALVLLVEWESTEKTHSGSGIRGIGNRGSFLPQPYRAWAHRHTAQTRDPEGPIIVICVALGSDVEDTTDAECSEFSHVREEAKFGKAMDHGVAERRGFF